MKYDLVVIDKENYQVLLYSSNNVCELIDVYYKEFSDSIRYHVACFCNMVQVKEFPRI